MSLLPTDLRLAAACARAREGRQRWRRLTCFAAAFLAAAALVEAGGLVRSTIGAQERYAARTAVLATSAAPTDLLLVERDDRVLGRQLAVLWVEPSSEAPPVLPPGLQELPAPGQAAISRALERALRRDPRAAERYRGAVLLAEKGTAGAGELLAVVRVERGRTLRGDERTVRVARFGAASAGDRVRPLGFPPAAEPGAVLLGAVALVGLPALLLVLVAVGASSGAVRDRARLLWVMGAGRRRVMRVAALEAILLLAPGAAVGAALATLAARSLSDLPLAGIVARDLVPSPLGLVLAVVVPALAGSSAAAVRARHFLAEARSERYAAPRSRLRGVAVTTVVVIGSAAAAWLVAAGIAERVGGPYAFLVAALTLAALVPLAVSPGVASVGRWLGERSDVAVHLAGRWLAHGPSDAARPFEAVALVTAIALGLAGYGAAALHDESSPALGRGPAGALVRWLDPGPEDVPRLRAGLPGALVVPVERRSGSTVLGVACVELRRLMPAVRCGGRGTVVLRDRGLGVLSAALGAYGDRVTATPDASHLGAVREALVVAPTDAADLDGRVRAVAFRSLPAPTVESDAPYRTRSDLARWLVAGLAVALVLGAVACLIGVVDRVAARAERLGVLAVVGTYPEQLERIRRLQLLVPFGVSVVAGTLAGLVISLAIVRRADVGYPYEALAVIALATIAALAIGLAAIDRLLALGR